MALRWAHAVMYVHDLDEMLDFWCDVMGMEVTDRGRVGDDESPEIVFMSQDPAHHHQLAMLPVRRNTDDRPNTVDHFAFRVDDIAEVRAMHDRLHRDGRATGIGRVTHGNAWSVYFEDPEGNGVEVFCDTPFHVAQPQFTTWDDSLSDDELLAWTRSEFADQPGFGAIEDFYEARRAHLAGRTTD